MRIRNVVSAVGVAACAMLLVMPASAADKPTPAKKTTETVKAVRSVWPPETLSGQIVSVDASKNLVIVKDASGVPFDVLVTPATKILSPADQKLQLSDLSSDTNHAVSVRIIPERKGDVAKSIDLSSRG